MNKEEKVDALAAAIQARDLAKVKNLVEEHGCLTTGPGPWNQYPLLLAAKSGKIDTIEYLISKYAQPDESTLLGAINSNMLHMVEYVSEKLEIEWTKRHFEAAFTNSFEIRRYAFEVANNEGWFEQYYFYPERDSDGHIQNQILDAARRALIDGSEDQTEALVEYLKETDNEHVLYAVPDGDSPLSWLHGFIRAGNAAGFVIAWKTLHERYYQKQIHAELDSYPWGESAQDFFYSAIEHGCDQIFYFMLSYTLPNFAKCIELARNQGNQNILDYLSKRMMPASQTLSY